MMSEPKSMIPLPPVPDIASASRGERLMAYRNALIDPASVGLGDLEADLPQAHKDALLMARWLLTQIDEVNGELLECEQRISKSLADHSESLERTLTAIREESDHKLGGMELIEFGQSTAMEWLAIAIRPILTRWNTQARK